MEQSSTVPQVAKKEYRNNTSGWVGVVTLDHNGAEQGVNIDPNGTIWLSDAEAILTARAPRNPADNPFLERDFVMVDTATGMRKNVPMRPVTLVSDRTKDMYASDRYVPGITDEAEARALSARAAHEGTDGPRTAATAAREAEVLGGPVNEPTSEEPTQLKPAPPSTGAPQVEQLAPPVVQQRAPSPNMATHETLAGAPGPAGQSDAEESWVGAPERPGEVMAGSLQGDDVSGTDPGDPTLPQPGDHVAPVPPQATPPTVGAALGEEHAQRVDPKVGEETGAAQPPNARQPEGEYASREEVGSPGAPTAAPAIDDESL